MPLIAVSIAWFASEIILARIKHSQSKDDHTDKGTLKLLWLTILISITIGVMAGLQTFGRFGTFVYLSYWFGISLIVSGLVLRWIAILTLKKYFTVDVAITGEHKIQNAGIYKFIRHPSYAGSLLSFLGLGLSFANIFSVIIIVLPICIAFLYRIRIEEKALTEAFGDDYIKYCSTTRRLIPGIY